jgi:hypothetical protein
VSGGSPRSGSAFHVASLTAAAAPAAQAGIERVGGSTPCEAIISDTNERNSTGSPSVTK